MVSQKKIFLRFFHYKSMGAHYPRGVANLDPRSLIVRISVGVCVCGGGGGGQGRPLNIAKYYIYKLWVSWFQRRRFFKFFPL